MRKKGYPISQGGHTLPLKWGVSARKARRYALCVDLTYIPEDGGGSQYSFMEAWDAGAVNVIHRDWLRYRGEMVDDANCLTVQNAQELADLVKLVGKNSGFREELKSISKVSTAFLEHEHNPVAIAKRYYEVLAKGINFRRFPRV